MGRFVERQKTVTTVITIINVFQKTLDQSGRKPYNIWVDRGSDFYNRLIKSWLNDNGFEMYLKHYQRKSVFAERFIRTLKNKICTHITAISKNVYIEKLDEIINKYSNTYHKTIKMKPVNVKSSTYIEYDVEHNDKDPKFKVGNYVRISK